MAELADYERRFRRAGLPLFIEDYSAREDVWTRAAPLLALVLIGELLGAIQLDWSLAAWPFSPAHSDRSICCGGGPSFCFRRTSDRPSWPVSCWFRPRCR